MCDYLTLDHGEDDVIIGKVLSELSGLVLFLEDLRLLCPFLLRQIFHLF